jgi:hypothetical protein
MVLIVAKMRHMQSCRLFTVADLRATTQRCDASANDHKYEILHVNLQQLAHSLGPCFERVQAARPGTATDSTRVVCKYYSSM